MTTKNKVLLAIILLALFGSLAAYLNKGDERRTSGATVPELTLRDYEGRDVSLAAQKGVPLVINSWAAWCPFCLRELPDLAAVQEEFGDQALFIAVNRAESFDTAKQYSDERGVTDKMMFLLDPDDMFYRAIGGFSMPETIFVDSAGIIQFHKRGPMERDDIRERTNELLQRN